MTRLFFAFLAALSSAAMSVPSPALASAKPSSAVSGLLNLQTLDQRLHNIGFRLVSANMGYCPAQVVNGGFLIHDIAQYPDAASARAAFGFAHPITVNAVAATGPAAGAGLQVGDGLIAINGQQLGALPLDLAPFLTEELSYRRIAAIRAYLQDALKNGPVNLTIARNSMVMTLPVNAIPTCASAFRILVSDDRKASANGKRVSVTSSLAEYAGGDDELAAIAAHELAHNLLNHTARLNTQKVNRGFFGQFGKSAKRIKDTEIEADRLSVWLMANAGYDPGGAIRFWTRFGKQYGKGIFSASTHYRWKKRVGLFEEEIAKMNAMPPVDGHYPPPLLVAMDKADDR